MVKSQSAQTQTKATARKVRAAIIRALDKHDAWEHVIIVYVRAAAMGHGPMAIKPDKDGLVSRRTPQGRMVRDLAAAIGEPMDLTVRAD